MERLKGEVWWTVWGLVFLGRSPRVVKILRPYHALSQPTIQSNPKPSEACFGTLKLTRERANAQARPKNALLLDCWRKIAISLIDVGRGVLSANACRSTLPSPLKSPTEIPLGDPSVA